MVTKTSLSAHSSPLGTTISPRLQRLLQTKRPASGSYGCVREVLHPLDPRAEPGAILFYDSSSDEEDADSLLTPGGINDKPTKRRLSFGTDIQSEKSRAGRGDARRSELGSSSNTTSPLHQTRSATDDTLEDGFLDKFRHGMALETPTKSSSSSSERGSTSPESLRKRGKPSPSRPRGTRAPENTPSESNINDLGLNTICGEINTHLQVLKREQEDINISDITSRLERLVEGLKAFSKADDGEGQAQFALDELTRQNVIRAEAAQQLMLKCQRKRTRMSQTAIISRWLVHDVLYGNDMDFKPSSSAESAQKFSPISQGASPSSPFVFRSHNQQDLSPLQSRSLYPSPRQRSRRKSDMAGNIATLQDNMKKLYCSAEVLVETKRLNASREHEASLRRNYDQVNEVSNKTKLENTLDTQLQRLLNERRAEEQASFEAQMRAEAEIRRKQEEEIRRAEQERARKQAEQEAARRKIEEEAAQRKAAEEQRRAQAEAARQSQEQEAARKKENEVKEKEMAAAKAKADAEDARVKDDQQKAQAAAAQQQQEQQQQKASAAAAVVQSTEYGRKILEVENMEMKKLLAKLKDVRKTVNADKEMYKRINAKKRALNPKLGQLNGETGQTTTVRTFIIQTLTDILKTEANGPMVDAALFQLPRDPRFEAKPPFQVPIAFIWMLNEFGKMVVRQVEAESAVSIKTANPIGVAVVSSLAREALMANGKSFIDIVIARLWKKCPILQGVLGPEDTERQMEGLGWRRVGGGTQWEGDEAHVNRMVGYCAGFSAIAGRNFMNTPTLTNPYPPFNLWFILTHFANHPNQLTNTHFFCIKTMLEVAGDTLKKVYGPQGEKLIRVVMGPLAAVGVKNQVAGAIGLGALAAKYDKDGKFL